MSALFESSQKQTKRDLISPFFLTYSTSLNIDLILIPNPSFLDIRHRPKEFIPANNSKEMRMVYLVSTQNPVYKFPIAKLQFFLQLCNRNKQYRLINGTYFTHFNLFCSLREENYLFTS